MVRRDGRGGSAVRSAKKCNAAGSYFVRRVGSATRPYHERSFAIIMPP